MTWIVKVYKRNNPDDIEEYINDLQQLYTKKEEIYCSCKVIGWKLSTPSWDNWKFMKRLLSGEHISYLADSVY